MPTEGEPMPAPDRRQGDARTPDSRLFLGLLVGFLVALAIMAVLWAIAT